MTKNVKQFLSDKLEECEVKIKHLKRKRKIVQVIYGITIVTSITVSTVTTTISGVFALPLLPTVIITTLSAVDPISTAISTKFNLKSRKTELNNMISRQERLKQQMNYVIKCNGDLTEKESNDIIRDFI